MSSSELQKEVIAYLKTAAALVNGNIFDAPPAGTPLPYISIGPSSYVPDEAECSDGQTETLQLDIWASALPNRALAKDITLQVVRALRGYRLPEDSTLRASPFRVTQFRVIDDPDPHILHGIVMLQVFLEDG